MVMEKANVSAECREFRIALQAAVVGSDEVIVELLDVERSNRKGGSDGD